MRALSTVADLQDQLQRLQEQLQKAQAQANELLQSIPSAAPEKQPPAPDPAESSAGPDEVARIQAMVQAQTSVPELQQQLIQALLENQQLRLALQQERQHHARTRQSLITALGDALDTLRQRRRSPKPP